MASEPSRGLGSGFAEAVQYYDRIYRYLWALTRDAARAEDLAQETYVTALGRWPTYTDEGRLYGWLKNIAYHALLDQARYAKRHPVTQYGDLVIDLRACDWAANDLLACEDDPEPLLASLTPGQRNVLRLVAQDFEGEDIAQQLGMTYGAVRVHKTRGLQALRERLAA